jgi:uncharacterized membrane protein HdeD (DUF308 family)
MAKYWWALALRGLAAVIFGVLAIVWPQITITVLVLLFGAFVFVDGLFAIIAAFTQRGGHDQWWLLLLEGLAGIGIGILTFFFPNATALVLVLFIAAWAIFTGILEIIAAIRLRKEIEGELFLGLAGVLSLIFGVLAFFFPESGATAIVWLIGAYAILFGIVMIILAFRLRSWRNAHLEDMRNA